MKRFTCCLLLACCLLAHRAGAVEPWPELPLPPKAHAQWVAQSMRVNGVPTRILQFQSRASRSEVVEYFRSLWSGGYPHTPSVKPLGEATVVGQMHGPYLMNVKVEDAERGASRGLISVAQVVGFKPDRDPGEIPMIGGAHVLSVIESDDPGKHSREVAILAPQQPSSVSQFYQAALANAGWRPVQVNDGVRTASGADSSFLVFARDASEIQLSIASTPRGRGTELLANVVTNDTGI